MLWPRLGRRGGYGAQRIRASRADRRERAEELDGVRRLADEDVTVFGEQLQRLGNEVSGRELDDDTRHDYQTALDAYERAKWDAPRLQQIEEISSLIDTLATGRYALACVRADRRRSGPRASGPVLLQPAARPVGARCDVDLRPPRHPTGAGSARAGSRRTRSPRSAPSGSACAPSPTWEAGAAFQPYSRGYFPADAAGVSSVAWLFAAPDPGWYGAGGVGADPGSFGGFDGGGFDGGDDGGGGGN